MRATNPLGSGVWAPTIVALVVIALGGTVYRTITNRFERASTEAPLPPGTLDAVPTEIGPWIGRDVDLAEDIVRATDTDDLLNREYKRVGGGTVGLYVAYGGRLRELAPHRPEVCYPGAGWVIADVRKEDLSLADGRALPCQIHRFGKGGFGSQQIVVLSCYLIDGRFARDISGVRSLAWQFDASASHMAHIQVVSSVGGPMDQAEARVRGFAMLAAPQIDDVLAHAIAEQEAERSSLSVNGASAQSLPGSLGTSEGLSSGAAP